MATTIPYSDGLLKYIGRAELEADSQGGFERYNCFVMALEQLPRSGLALEDQRTAQSLLERRARETKPANIGIASSDGGSEAD